MGGGGGGALEQRQTEQKNKKNGLGQTKHFLHWRNIGFSETYQLIETRPKKVTEKNVHFNQTIQDVHTLSGQTAIFLCNEQADNRPYQQMMRQIKFDLRLFQMLWSVYRQPYIFVPHH